jgi:Bax protein
MELRMILHNRHHNFLAGLFILCLLWSTLSLFKPESSLPALTVDYSADIKTLPDFSAIKDISQKKQTFLNFLYPVIEKENRFLIKIRAEILNLQSAAETRSLNTDELAWLEQLSEEYLIDWQSLPDIFEQLLLRINSVPPSLVLAQAAIESGWGSSRFAKKGNNLFGHWCFQKGCGIVPNKRDQNKTHEVASFKSVNDSIRAYLKNLNTFYRYDTFRALRQQHIRDDAVEVEHLLPGLLAYSELGAAYLKKVRRMIRQNQLKKFDADFYQTAG